MPDLRQRHSTAHEGAPKAQQPNSRIRHARMHADHREQIKYTCKRVNSVGNAELPARGAEPRMSEPKRLENKPGTLSAFRTLQKACECLKTNQKVSEDPKTAAQSQNYLVQAQIHAQRGHRGCHDRDIPPQPSHICSCLLAVQTPPEHFLTKPEPIPGLPDPSIAFLNSSAAFPKGCCTDVCLVSIPEAVNIIPEHI